MENNNKILYISIAILVLAVGILFGTYAYYQTTITGTISGNVAKWSFKANGETSSFNLDLGDLYPGVSGTYNIELSAENSELDVYYEVYFYWDGFPNGAADLYLDSNYTMKIHGCDDNDLYGLYGTISAGEKINIPIYLNWPYDGNDYEGDADGRQASYIVEIVGQQYTGYSGSIPMYFFDGNYDNGYIRQLCVG